MIPAKLVCNKSSFLPKGSRSESEAIHEYGSNPMEKSRSTVELEKNEPVIFSPCGSRADSYPIQGSGSNPMEKSKSVFDIEKYGSWSYP